jgi:putative methyltransferase (TIGR04325 family)
MRDQLRQFAKTIIACRAVLWVVRRLSRFHSLRSLFIRASQYRWIYPSFDEAAQSVPNSRKIGFNHPEASDLYLSHAEQLMPSDYPVLYWLHPIMDQCTSLFDFGGNIGMKYYVYESYLKYRKDFRWCVCDLPVITEAGARFARQKQDHRILFTNSFADSEGTDVLLASGSLQYVDVALSVLIAGLTRKPKHIFVNRTPLSENPDFVSLQDIGPVVCPYLIRNRAAFIESLQKLNYGLVDSWDVPSLTFYIPCFPEFSVLSYSGFYFRQSSNCDKAAELSELVACNGRGKN